MCSETHCQLILPNREGICRLHVKYAGWLSSLSNTSNQRPCFRATNTDGLIKHLGKNRTYE